MPVARPAGLTVVWDPTGANQAMTQITNAVSGSGTSNIRLLMFGLVNPASGSKTCTASWSSSTPEAHLNLAAFTGVNQANVATAFPNGVGVEAASATVSQNITSAVGNMVAACMGQAINFWSTIGPTSIDADGTASSFAMASVRGTGATTVTVTGTWGGSAGDNHVCVGCDILAAGGGTAASMGKPSGTIFVPGKHSGPTHGLRPTQAFPPAPSTTVPIGTSMIWM